MVIFRKKISSTYYFFFHFYPKIKFWLYFTHKMIVSEFSRAYSHYNVAIMEVLILVSVERGHPYEFTGSKFKVIWLSILKIRKNMFRKVLQRVNRHVLKRSRSFSILDQQADCETKSLLRLTKGEWGTFTAKSGWRSGASASVI